MRRLMLVVLVGVLVVAGCGDDSGGGSQPGALNDSGGLNGLVSGGGPFSEDPLGRVGPQPIVDVCAIVEAADGDSGVFDFSAIEPEHTDRDHPNTYRDTCVAYMAGDGPSVSWDIYWPGSEALGVSDMRGWYDSLLEHVEYTDTGSWDSRPLDDGLPEEYRSLSVNFFEVDGSGNYAAVLFGDRATVRFRKYGHGDDAVWPYVWPTIDALAAEIARAN